MSKINFAAFGIAAICLSQPMLAGVGTHQAIPQPVSQPLVKAHHSAATIDYFLEIALGAEFGKGSKVIRKWQGNVRVQVFGNPTNQDMATLNSVIAEINELAGGAVQLEPTKSNPHIKIHFVPEARFPQIEPNYQPGNSGYFWARWNEQNAITSATILIDTEKVTQAERSHLIREELTQAMGLMSDSWKYPDSIFYQGWTATGAYSKLDRAIISILYNPKIKSGMGKKELERVLKNF